MSMVFELWDKKSRNLLDVYESEDDALEDVFAAVSTYGPHAIDSLLLGHDADGRSRPIAEGSELARRAQAWHDRTNAPEQTPRRAPIAR